MGVLFCTLDYYPSPAGGAERQARLQAEELDRRGHRTTVVCPRSTGFATGRVGPIEVHRLRCIDRRGLRTLTYLPFLTLFLLRRLRSFDVVHIHLANLQADLVVTVARLLRRPAYVKLACGGTVGEVARMKGPARVTRYVGLRKASTVQALSDEIVDELMSIGVDARRVVQIPNGLDLKTFRPGTAEEKGAARDRLGLPEKATIALFTGRFARYKGIHDLLAVHGDMQHSGLVLALVGSAETDRPIAEIQQSESLIVRGWTDSVVDYMRAADIFVVPSYADGMSNALLEAMGCGLAIVATRVGAAEEMIEDGVSGLLIEPGDRVALAAALESLLVEPALRLQLGRSARSAVERFAIPRVVERIEEAYRDMVDGRLPDRVPA